MKKPSITDLLLLIFLAAFPLVLTIILNTRESFREEWINQTPTLIGLSSITALLAWIVWQLKSKKD